MTTQELLARARQARGAMALADTQTKDRALLAMAEELEADTAPILAANALDLEGARGRISEVMLDRLALSPDRIAGMAKGIREVAALPDPVGAVLSRVERPNGLVIEKTAVPMGVIAIIYESRPNVTSDAAALALKAGSACVLRGGKEAHRSAAAIVAALKESRYDTGLDLDLLFEIAEYWEEVRKRGHYKRGVSSLTHMKVYSHQVPGGMMSNLVSQLEIQNAGDRLPEVMQEIPKVRAEVGYPPLVTPLSQIVGTQAVFNVLTGKRWSVVSKEMKDYICGYYGKAPGRMDKDIVAKVVGNSEMLPPDIAPGSLVTTTYSQVGDEIGDLAKSEEDVLMYALFPNEARTYLSKHRTSEKVDFLMEQESSHTKEDDYVDINQIRELVRVAEESGVGEIVVEEEGTRIAVRMPGTLSSDAMAAAAAAAPVAAVAPAPAAEASASADDGVERPSNWYCVTAPMVGTFYTSPAPGEPPFVQVGDEVAANQTLCIVEAMKLMNEIAAEEMGTVREVCLSDATPVEYGTVLFYVEPHDPTPGA